MPSRILHVVWSGVGWDRLQPLLDHGLLPTLGLLIQRGTRARLTSLQPEVPIQLSQAVLSGLPGWAHGLIHTLKLDESGNPRVTTLADAIEPGLPIWLAKAGIDAIWVGWPHVAPGCADCQQVVSRAYALDDAGADPHLPLEDCRVAPADIGIEHLQPLFPESGEADILQDPSTPVLQQVLAEAGSLQAAATRLMQRLDWTLASVRFELGDQIGQLFGDCHPPLDENADTQRVMRYQHMVTGAYRLLDMMLARLVQLADQNTLVLVHSEKGTARSAPPSDPSAPVHRRFRSSHDNCGFLVLSGEGVRVGQPLWAASILDIAPTLMHALGVTPPEVAGRVLNEGLDGQTVPEMSPLAERTVEVLAAEDPLPTLLVDDAIAHGECESRDQIDAVQLAQESLLFRALSMMQNAAPEQALPILERLTETHPQVRRFILHRARCHLMLGQLETARQCAERFVELGESDLRSHLLLGRIALLEDRTDQALVHFFQAEQLRPDDPSSHCQIGDAYRRGNKLEQARDAFGRALALDPVNVDAHLGLAKIELLEGNDEPACQACFMALESDYRNPEAHFHLGVGLARLERVGEAIQAFEACLSLAPGKVQGHEWLARLYRLTEDGMEKAAVHQAKAMTARQSSPGEG